MSNHFKLAAIFVPHNEIAYFLESSTVSTNKLCSHNSFTGFVIVTGLLGEKIHTLASLFLFDANSLLVHKTAIFEAIFAL